MVMNANEGYGKKRTHALQISVRIRRAREYQPTNFGKQRVLRMFRPANEARHAVWAYQGAWTRDTTIGERANRCGLHALDMAVAKRDGHTDNYVGFVDWDELSKPGQPRFIAGMFGSSTKRVDIERAIEGNIGRFNTLREAQRAVENCWLLGLTQDRLGE